MSGIGRGQAELRQNAAHATVRGITPVGMRLRLIAIYRLIVRPCNYEVQWKPPELLSRQMFYAVHYSKKWEE